MSNSTVRKKRSPLNVVEREFHDAIDRLLAGKPRVPKLRRLSAEGRLHISPTTVACESGRSRTLIALKDSRLPSVRNRILEIARKEEFVAPRTAADVIIRLREQIVDLKQQLAASLEAQAEYFHQIERAERDAGKWREAFKREQNHQEQDRKVTSLRPKT